MPLPNSPYIGKVKTVEYLDDDRVKIIFTDDITAGDGAKRATIAGKGALNLALSYKLMDLMGKAGIPHHMLELQTDTVLIARNLTIFPIEVVVRNVVAGSFARRYGISDGEPLSPPLVEYFVKNDELHDPLIDGSVVVARNILTQRQFELITAHAMQVNKVLYPYFLKAQMLLVDFKLEFGYDAAGHIFLADELSADSMRVWDTSTAEKLDKDRFRKDLGDVLAGYRDIYDRLNAVEYIPEPPELTATVVIQPKVGVTNPAGNVTRRTLLNAGLADIGTVTMGKIVRLQVKNTSDPIWLDQLNEVCKTILSNPLVESYTIRFS